MEGTTLVNIISNLVIFSFKSLNCEIENFFCTAWKSLCSRMQISNTSGVDCLNSEKSGVQKANVDCLDVDLVISRLGIGGGFENDGEMGGFCEKDLLGLFDEMEPSLEEIKESFRVYDANGDGFIDGSELQRVVHRLGLKCNLEECSRMIAIFDCNGDGLIDFREFVKLMEKCLC